MPFFVLCAFSKYATRGRGSTDGERLGRLKACDCVCVCGVCAGCVWGWGGGYLIYLITAKENVCVCG